MPNDLIINSSIMKVKEVVFAKVPPVSKNDLAVRARALMRQYSVRALPVFDGEKLIGVITRSDLIKITSTKSNITVGGLLWKPLITLNADQGILDAAKILLREDLKQLPVIENGKFLGFVRDVDILSRIIFLKLKPKKKIVNEIMTSRVKTFSFDDDISKVWGLITEHSGFPVLQKGKVVGIISTPELLDSKRARIERESKTIKKPAKIGHVMRITIGHEEKFFGRSGMPIEQAIKRILEANLSILPIVEKNNKLIGIVTRKDLLKAYI